MANHHFIRMREHAMLFVFLKTQFFTDFEDNVSKFSFQAELLAIEDAIHLAHNSSHYRNSNFHRQSFWTLLTLKSLTLQIMRIPDNRNQTFFFYLVERACWCLWKWSNRSSCKIS